MKKTLIISLLSVMAFSACAGSELTVSDLAKNPQTQDSGPVCTDDATPHATRVGCSGGEPHRRRRT